MDSIRAFSNIIGPFSSDDISPLESHSSGLPAFTKHKNGISIASTISPYDGQFGDPVQQLAYYLDLLRPQGRTRKAKDVSHVVSDDQQSKIRPISGEADQLSPIYVTPRVPDNLAIDPVDSNYLQFFFVQAHMFLLFTQHFPSAPSAILELAQQHSVTLQSILAVSAQHADMLAGRKPTRALIHLSKCLPQIQSALTSVQINEGHITAVYCLARLHFARRERSTARKHLYGLYLMLEQYQQCRLDGSGSPSSPSSKFPRPPSPFMMFLWRIAIQMDLALGNRGQELVFPSPMPGQDDFHRQWVSRIASPEGIEWALAEFALDDLRHHTLSLEKLAIKLRSSPFYDAIVDEARIQSAVNKLWDMHQQWKLREVVRQASRAESLYRQCHPVKDSDGQFLHYGPPLRFQNEFFVRMLLYHTERIIHIDEILTQSLTKPSERCVRAAIEVCRIIAGVKDMSAGDGIGQYFQGLNYAGLVFNPRKYPDEFNWVVQKLKETDILSGYDSGSTLVGMLKETWDSENPWETYRRLSGRSVPSS